MSFTTSESLITNERNRFSQALELVLAINSEWPLSLQTPTVSLLWQSRVSHTVLPLTEQVDSLYWVLTTLLGNHNTFLLPRLRKVIQKLFKNMNIFKTRIQSCDNPASVHGLAHSPLWWRLHPQMFINHNCSYKNVKKQKPKQTN